MDARTTLRHVGTWALVEIGYDYTKPLVTTENSVTLSLKRKGRGIKKLVITLNGLDLYDVEYYVFNSSDFQVVVHNVVTNIYAESLGDAVTNIFK